MKSLNNLLWNVESETEGQQPWFSMDACCGGSGLNDPGGRDPGRGTGKPPTFTEK